MSMENRCLGALASYEASQAAYKPIPSDYSLRRVIIIHRHGDRTQISRNLGVNYPENKELTDFWQTKLPTETTLQSLSKVAKTISESPVTDEIDSNNLRSVLYSGWDKDNIPYGQLTELGAQQMIFLGKVLSERYFNSLHLSRSDINERNTLLRSTHSCRTVQSLMSLLVGMGINDTTKLLPIRVRSKAAETLFPQANASCDAISRRRTYLLSKTKMGQCIDDFEGFEMKMRRLFGYGQVIPWLTIKEVITCQLVHDYPIPNEMSIEDDVKLSNFAAWLWGLLYKVSSLDYIQQLINRFIIRTNN